jgi:hypothetical protein
MSSKYGDNRKKIQRPEAKQINANSQANPAS